MTIRNHLAYSLQDFSYDLPHNLIADYPTAKRSDSRLLCLNKNTGVIKHQNFKDILSFINSGDLLVLNDTRVIPARLFAFKLTGGKVEILVERILKGDRFLAHLKSSKTLKTGIQLQLKNGTRLEILGRLDNLFELHFVDKISSIFELLNKLGHMPLPPYIKRPDEIIDQTRFQTVFAQFPGAIAAPTAGLHFDEQLLQLIKEKGVDIAFVTLHIGSGTFKPIRTKRIEEHRMHSEYVSVSPAVCAKIDKAKKDKKRIIAIGTTTVRSLETAASSGFIKPFQGQTDIFIYPGFQFQCVDVLLTNFHLPQSTLLMLVCAFAGYELTMEVYRQAIAHHYRFFSYGDAMWVDAC